MMETIISSLVSAIAAALIATLTTIFVERRKEKNRKSEQDEQKRRETFENRPEYKIIDYKDYISRTGYGIKQKCDLDVFLTSIIGIKTAGRVDAYYREEDFDQSEWCCVIYTLENVGKTDISVTDVICHHKRTKVIFERYAAEIYCKERCLNYSVSCDKKIRVGETITLKLCYHKNHVIESVVDAILSIGLRDSNGNRWEQPLFVPFNKIYDSYRVKNSDYRSDILTDDAEECFREPWKW